MKPLFTTLALATLASTVGCHQEEQSWAEYVDSVETTLQETGHCPLGPPQVVPQYGEYPRVPGPRGLRSSTEAAEGTYDVNSYYTSADLSYGPGWYGAKDKNCVLSAYDANSGRIASGFEVWADGFEKDAKLPPTVWDVVNYTDDISESAGIVHVYRDIEVGTELLAAKATDARMSLCLEEVIGPRGFDGNTPADWRGSAYFQVESWKADGDVITESGTGCSRQPVPTDYFIKLDGMGCGWGEDASNRADPDYLVNWGWECDGIDNDLDGVIDEGQHFNEMDLDDNGVADCMDDWDGDGIPNTDDEDVYECCRGPSKGSSF